ncbi:MAG: squalene--hopene cyclase [Nitrospirales bacterium]
MKPSKFSEIGGDREMKTNIRPVPNSSTLSQKNSSQLPTEELAINLGTQALLQFQHHDGYWCFDLESDPGMSADYILMMHYMDEIDEVLQAKIAIYLREHQSADGGWPLYFGGPSDLSCSVKTYYALKLAGDHPDLPHMKQARGMILAKGGAVCSSVFVKITLALFRQIPWKGTPFLPVETILLPRWFPFHIQKVSYWSRTVMVPLLILCTLKPQAKNPHAVGIAELFKTPPDQITHWHPFRSPLNGVFLALDWVGKRLESLIPHRIRQRALKKAEHWIVERLNGTGGLGAILPALIGAYEVLDCLGYPPDHPYRITAKQALEGLLVVGDRSAWCQTCLSPVWDTALACLALQEVNRKGNMPAVSAALRWLQQHQLLDDPGDWRENRPNLKGGGWTFEFQNSHYPDLDDTAAVAYAMYQSKDPCFQDSIQRAADWLAGMQSRNGGFASYDADNTYYYLNEIPFADHGALLDPPTSDVSARCLLLLSAVERESPQFRTVCQACLTFLLPTQTSEGSWWGRWGTNYIYGTWSVLMALEIADIPPDASYVQRAANWLKSIQRKDGGWGEDNDTYHDAARQGQGYASTSFQTAWALLGLMAAGEVHCAEVRKGINYLLRTQKGDGSWKDDWFSAPGFPRVLYLKYGGYGKYFPLWALARYRNLLIS